MKKLLLSLIRFYRRSISPLFPPQLPLCAHLLSIRAGSH